MSWDEFSEHKPPSAAQLRAQAAQRIQVLTDEGYQLTPIPTGSRNGPIGKSFWGKAWCKHLEAFSDYEYHLPRGRSYVRNGAVVDLKIEPQTITALVNGSELYQLTVNIDALEPSKWAAIKARCQGKIGSLVELLKGTLSDETMSLVIDSEGGLFPKPSEIHFNCNCPDWADMCKHVAAALYGVGVRLDESPELLFKLRGVDHTELITLGTAVSDLSKTKGSRRRRTLDSDAINDVFGLDLDD